jgi:outer membrane protein assembly factor BamA
MIQSNRMRAALAAMIVFSGLAGWALAQGIPDKSYKSFSPMPILMFDPDIGVGYGGKVKFVDFLKKKESFDLILFNSSKGERWYVFTFSIPDLEIRQGKTYRLSFDFKAEYDKYLKYIYYGPGQDSRQDDKTIFTHETKSLLLTFGRGITPQFAVAVSYNFRWLSYSNIEADKPFTGDLKQFEQKGTQYVPYASLILRYDTSDSQIHPTRGIRLIFQDDLAAGIVGAKDAKFNRISLDFRKYMRVFGEKDVFAFRTLAQYVSGDQVPFFDLCSLGGGAEMNAMRGYSLNRFLDKGKFLANIEYRFPIVWRFGGNLFVDTGTVWPSLSKVDFGKLAFDYGFGLRLYLKDFCARVDLGFSKETTGLYFNFGHIF